MTFELTIVVLVLLGLFGTIANTMIGGGGGVIFVPVLILLFGLSPNSAIATSYVAVSIGASVSTLAYSRQRTIDYRAGFVLGLLTLPGAFVGAFITEYVQQKTFNSVLGVVIVVLAILLWFGRNYRELQQKSGRSRVDDDKETLSYAVNKRVAYLFAIFTGFFAGIFGAGGGLIATPAMVLAGFPIHVAVATSRLIILILSLGASVTRVSLGQAHFEYAVSLSVGSVGGAFIGARVARGLSDRLLTKVVSLLVAILGIALLLESLP